MPETTFESALGVELRGYADGGVRPIDRHAVSRAAIAAGTRRGLGHRLPSLRDPSVRAKALLAAAVLGSLLLAGTLVVLGIGSTRPPTPSPAPSVTTLAPTARSSSTPATPTPSGYEGVLLQASAGAPDTDVDVVAVGAGGQERIVRHLAASILADGRRFTTFGEVSQDGWLAVHTDLGSTDASPAFALVDLRDPARPLRLVPYQPVIGGAWGPHGLFAAPVAGPTWTIRVVDAESGATSTLERLSLPGGGPDLIWAADGSGLLLIDRKGGFAIAPIDGSPPIPGRPALMPDLNSRYLAPDGTKLIVCATESGSGCSDHPSAPVWTTAGGEVTDWYAGELGPAHILGATFAADWRSVWLALYTTDGSHRIAIIAHAETPGQWRVAGETDLGTGTETIYWHGIAADDSVLAILRDNGTGIVLPSELIRTEDGAGSTHKGNLLGFVPPEVTNAWPDPGSD